MMLQARLFAVLTIVFATSAIASAMMTTRSSAPATEVPAVNSQRDTTIILLRHAEKLNDGSRDPALSELGTARALALASALEHAQVEHIYATPFQRTRSTAQPLADAQNITVQTLDIAGGLDAHSQRASDAVAQHSGSTIVIIGHSNTIPALVKNFSNIDIGAMDEDAYGDLYILQLNSSDATATLPPRLIVTTFGTDNPSESRP
ncbi:MAG: phosphoglycerate mutase family protein [Phycisphaerales bacterium]